MKRALPAHASLEYLRKAAKDSLRELRRLRPDTKLAEAQHRLAQEHASRAGALSKRTSKPRATTAPRPFFAACDAADLPRIERLLAADPTLVHERHSHHRRTALHRAAIAQSSTTSCASCSRRAPTRTRATLATTCTRIITPPRRAPSEIVAACLDAGGDVHGEGDVHRWAYRLGRSAFNGYHPGVAPAVARARRPPPRLVHDRRR
jgi:hypothetical protein